MKTKIFTFVLVIPVLLLVYILIAGVKQPIDEEIYIEKTEKTIIRKLKFIRKLQITYRSVNGQYTGNWDKLIDFVKNGKIPIIQRSEQEKDSAGIKIPVFIVDTLDIVSVKSSLIKEKKQGDKEDKEYEEYKDYKEFLENIDKLAEIPNSKGKKFSLYAGAVEQGNLSIPVFEVKDIYPINPAKGAQFNEEGEAYSVPTLIKHYETKLKERSNEALKFQLVIEIKTIKQDIANKKGDIKENNRKLEGFKEQLESFVEEQKIEKEVIEDLKTQPIDKLKKQLEEVSKYINLYGNRIEQLEEKPLRVGSREEATTAGNWE